MDHFASLKIFLGYVYLQATFFKTAYSLSNKYNFQSHAGYRILCMHSRVIFKLKSSKLTSYKNISETHVNSHLENKEY